MSYSDDPSTSLRTASEQLTYLLFLKMEDERTYEQVGKASV
jgi:type I restriction enzyme M protein